MDEGRKRVLLIAASILAARKPSYCPPKVHSQLLQEVAWKALDPGWIFSSLAATTRTAIRRA
jgi:hypothetical protein